MPQMPALKMKGLPFSVKLEDIVSFFSGQNLVENSIKIGYMSDGRLTGEAVCKFESSVDCQNAHRKLDG